MTRYSKIVLLSNPCYPSFVQTQTHARRHAGTHARSHTHTHTHTHTLCC